MKVWQSVIISLILAAILFAAGLFVGRYIESNKILPTTTDTIYVAGDTIFSTVSVEKLVPYRVTDSVFINVPADTAAIYETLLDYYREREYAVDLGNDTVGTFRVNTVVKENKLSYIDAIIVPTTRVVTNTVEVDKKKFLQGYVSIGTSVHNFNTQQISGGVEFVERYDVGATVIRFDNKFGYTINFGIKF